MTPLESSADQLPVIEQLGNQLAECRMALAAQKRTVALLLSHVGDQGACKGCHAEIWWILHRNGKRAPYNADGTNHFASCPRAAQFQKMPVKANVQGQGD